MPHAHAYDEAECWNSIENQCKINDSFAYTHNSKNVTNKLQRNYFRKYIPEWNIS
jgi:hypothetical protein